MDVLEVIAGAFALIGFAAGVFFIVVLFRTEAWEFPFISIEKPSTRKMVLIWCAIIALAFLKLAFLIRNFLL